MEKIVVCGANAYEQKYYFNKQFEKIPQSVQDDLHILCVLFTEEVGGIFTIGFDEEGELLLETRAEEDDIYYDEIASGMFIKQVRDNRQEIFEALQLYYRALIKKEPIEQIIAEAEAAGLNNEN
jgi:hypothetical protein